MAPNMEKPMMNPTAEVAVNVRFLKSQSGMMGSDARVSMKQKIPSDARATSPGTDDDRRTPGVFRSRRVVSRMMQVTPSREGSGSDPVDLVRYPLDREVEHRTTNRPRCRAAR